MDAIPAVERDIALDLVKRGLLVSPAVVLVAGLIQGVEGAIGAALGLGDRARELPRRRVPRHVGRAPLARRRRASPRSRGYVVRLAVIVAALFLLRDVSWLDFATLGITLVGAHIGLLTWEARHVTLSLAAPGLRPNRPAAVSGDE